MSAPELPAALKAKILESAKREASPTTARSTLRAGVLAALVPAWLAASLLLAGVRPDLHELPAPYAVGTLALIGAAALVLTSLAVSRGPRMLGVRIEWLLGAIVGLPLVMCVWSSLVVGQGPSSHACATPSEALASSPPCLVAALVIATPLAAAMLWIRRGALGGSPALTGAAVGAAAATWAHLVLHAHCPVTHPLHALVGHLLPIVPAAGLAAIVARRLDR